MDTNAQSFADNAIAFTKQFYHSYLEERDFARCLTMFAPEVTWIGTGAQEVCHSIEDAKRLLAQEAASWDGHFLITGESYQVVPLQAGICNVYGEMHLVEDGPDDALLLSVSARFSVLLRQENAQFLLVHMHFSLPNSEQKSDEFIHKTMVEDYNAQLEQKLAERSMLLRNKTHEMELLADNIYGGVEICLLDEALTVQYASVGFEKLTGYTANALNAIGGHMAIMLPGEGATHKAEVLRQVAATGHFTMQYRIRHKDGRLLWVQDQGVDLTEQGGPARVQSILVDITAQKDTEAQLRLVQKRYEIAMAASEVTMFEYNVETRQLTLFERDAEFYGVSKVVENGSETFVKTGIIAPEHAADYLAMYRKIHEGAPTASCRVSSRDINGVAHDFELTFTNIFNDEGKPVRAIGVRRDVSLQRKLAKEIEYANTLATGQRVAFEANLTRDTLINVNEEWRAAEGVGDCKTLSALMDKRMQQLQPEYGEALKSIFSLERAQKALELGQRQIYCEYQLRDEARSSLWYRSRASFVRDGASGDVFARCYITDVTAIKEKEKKSKEEQRYYEAMRAKSVEAYTANLTKDQLLSGFDYPRDFLGMQDETSYTKLQKAALKNLVHPEDQARLSKILTCANIIASFKSGVRELTLEYRACSVQEFYWMRTTAHIYKESESGDVCAMFFIEDINEMKTAQLDIAYKAEHDLLTGLYNKINTQKQIDDFLQSAEGKAGKHAFFILDIDYFKGINDNFGHAFGDAVLSQIAAKIKDLFRDMDVLGRIGGDEFVVLMKNVRGPKIVQMKAKEMCERIADSYTKGTETHRVSASVGVTYYPENGTTYDTLYQNADTALYSAKENGRNCYAVYVPQMGSKIRAEGEMDSSEYELDTLDANIAQHVFRIIYESDDKNAALNAVLELVGKYYRASRAYIFEQNESGTAVCCTFEWCRDDIAPQIKELHSVPYSVIGDYQTNFDENGIFAMLDIHKVSQQLQTVLLPQGICSMLQFAIIKDGAFKGFIGFDECDHVRVPSKKELTELKSIANILGVFILEMRSVELIYNANNISTSIINGLDSYAYVCDPITYEILFVNHRTQEIIPQIAMGQRCYSAIWNRTSPCTECPVRALIESGSARYSMDMYNTNLDLWVKASASWINWIGGGKKCLVDSVDITKYKKK